MKKLALATLAVLVTVVGGYTMRQCTACGDCLDACRLQGRALAFSRLCKRGGSL